MACGAGWASIALATAYPKVRVDGFDLDAAFVERAARNAAAAGVSRPGQLRRRRRRRPEPGRRVSGGHDVRGPARHRPTGRGAGSGSGAARRRRLHDHRRRAGRGGVHRARRRRGAADVRVQHPALPAGQPHREPVRGHRHRAAIRQPAATTRTRLASGRWTYCPSRTRCGASIGWPARRRAASALADLSERADQPAPLPPVDTFVNLRARAGAARPPLRVPARVRCPRSTADALAYLQETISRSSSQRETSRQQLTDDAPAIG